MRPRWLFLRCMHASVMLAVPAAALPCRLRHSNTNRNDQHCQLFESCGAWMRDDVERAARGIACQGARRTAVGISGMCAAQGRAYHRAGDETDQMLSQHRDSCCHDGAAGRSSAERPAWTMRPWRASAMCAAGPRCASLRAHSPDPARTGALRRQAVSEIDRMIRRCAPSRARRAAADSRRASRLPSLRGSRMPHSGDDSAAIMVPGDACQKPQRRRDCTTGTRPDARGATVTAHRSRRV